VLIKVSGYQDLAGDSRLLSYKASAASFVTAFRYHDRMTGIPTHDEQGTRDRPYDLIVRLDHHKIDDALHALGLTPWHRARPKLAAFVGLHQGATTYVLTGDGERGAAERQSFYAAATKRGMPVVLPSAAVVETFIIDYATISDDSSSKIKSALQVLGGEVGLTGQLVWIEAELGWATQWHMVWQDRSHHWRIRGVTFDEAFRRGIGGVAQILSNNVDPK
jgi:hypothetical protein